MGGTYFIVVSRKVSVRTPAINARLEAHATVLQGLMDRMRDNVTRRAAATAANAEAEAQGPRFWPTVTVAGRKVCVVLVVATALFGCVHSSAASSCTKFIVVSGFLNVNQHKLVFDGTGTDTDSLRADPKGEDARDVIGRVVGFVNLGAVGVPWSGRKRAGELTKLMAVHRYAGPASLFYSVAPDPVHNLNVKATGQSASVGWHLVGV